MTERVSAVRTFDSNEIKSKIYKMMNKNYENNENLKTEVDKLLCICFDNEENQT